MISVPSGRFPRAWLQPLPSLRSVQGLQLALFPLESPLYTPINSGDVRIKTSTYIVLVIKYRKKVLDARISDFAKEMFITLGNNYHITLTQWNHDANHIHVLFKAHPKTELSKFLNAYKSASSRIIKKVFPEYKEKLWKEHFWSKGFCLITIGGATLDVVKEYIQKQGQ